MVAAVFLQRQREHIFARRDAHGSQRGAAHLRADNKGQAARLDELAQRAYTSSCGALLYEVLDRDKNPTSLKLHLDDIGSCNGNPFDPRDVLWNFGNDCTASSGSPATTPSAPILRVSSKVMSSMAFRRSGQRTAWKPQRHRVHTVTLHHGDALLINVEKIAHGLDVLSTSLCSRTILSERRVCVPVRPKADAAYEANHAAWRRGGKATARACVVKCERG